MQTQQKPRKTESFAKRAEALTLNSIFSSGQKSMLRVGVWDFKGEQDNLCGDEKSKRLQN